MARLLTTTALAGLALTVAACDLVPRAGPNKREIFAGSVLREGDAFVVDVNSRVTAATAIRPSLGFSQAIRGAGRLGADTIRAGDTLSLVVYENVEDGLLTGPGAAASLIDEVQVDSAGFIFVPYAGRLRAAGNTPEGLRRVITQRLDEQTPDPQVLVRRVAGDGATVSVVGVAGGQGLIPITRPTRTLTALIAAAGGITVPPETIKVTLVRGARKETAWLTDLFHDPAMDVALRDGDTIFLEQDTRAFSVLGATSTQNRLEFQTQTLSAIEAIAQVGGLNPSFANPTGVFVFRNEPELVARRVMGRDDLIGTQRVVYVLDLTEPNGMFEARDFVIRDGDTLYVTEAPIVSFNRTVAAALGTLGNATAAAGALGVN